MEQLPYFGAFCGACTVNATIAVLLILGFGYVGAPLFVWSIATLILLYGFGASQGLFLGAVIVLAVFNITPIRRVLLSSIVMKILKPIMPKISETERTALEAGVVWIETDLFSGKPDFKKILAEPYPVLTADEKAFLDGPVNKVCEMTDAWSTWKNRELEQNIWDYIKKERFLGMIIPKEYGGLGFSALAHSEVIMKLSSRSMPLAITVMVPNSLGPGELLIHYGTDEQKKKFLPRLAAGQEIPCFGLTEPTAGSDAGSITATGELFKGEDGKYYLKLNWNKRWITLAAVSTIVGLAFRLKDPKNYLGKGEDVGITCALIPAKTPGVVLGRRHDPLGVPFYNCPTEGHDVILPAEEILVGGLAMAGQGWRMLMECLSAGRGISLPSQSTGGSKLATRVTSAHSVIRQQFGVSIGSFEGVQEPLATIAGMTYMLDALRKFTVGAIDQGIKPPVITAIAKYYATEMGRRVINDAMDIMGGAGISLGERNLLAETYVATPIGITVEGANIMTRTLIIFGQGALRAHPYAFKELKAIDEKNLAAFDLAFWGHVGHIIRNSFRAVILSATRGHVARTQCAPELGMYQRRLTWASASFAILADLAMGTLGGSLKFREKITGRFADVLSWMYISTCVIRRYEAEGRNKEHLAFAKWALKHALSEMQHAFDGIFDNMFGVEQKSIVGKIVFGSAHFIFKQVLGAWSRINSIGSQATDHLKTVMCEKVLNHQQVRLDLTEGIYVPTEPTEQLGRLERAFELVHKAEAIERKVYKARKAGQLPRLKGPPLHQAALDNQIISAAEFELVKKAQEARLDAIQVDSFTEEEYHNEGHATAAAGVVSHRTAG